jgi:GNAT superfamily N-acetyltransferase
MLEIRIEPARTDADIERSLEVHNVVHAPHRAVLSDVHETARQSRDFAVFNAFLDGEVAGSAQICLPGHSNTPSADIFVLPERRGRGVGHGLYRELSRWAAARDATALRASVTEGKEKSLAFARRRGFVEVSRDELVQLDLAAIEEPEVDPPAGIEISTWAAHPGLARGLYEVTCEAWPDIPASELERIEPFAEWLSAQMRGADDDPRAVFVALAGEEVVGYAKLNLSDAQPKQAVHSLTGVKRAWRRRGIARALKQAQIAWAKQEGLERLLTVNELRNEPIRRLNEQFGYQPIPGRIRLRGPLAGTDSASS